MTQKSRLLSVGDRWRFCIRIAANTSRPPVGRPRRQRPQHRLCPLPLGSSQMCRGLSVVLVLAAFPNQPRKIWRSVQTSRPIVLLLLLLERTRTGEQAEAGPNRLVRRVCP